MRTIAIGDVHGCYNELKELITTLEQNGKYNKDTDRIVFLGDYIDRGPDSRLVIEFIRNLQKENKNVIALMGNHESMLLEYYDGLGNDWTFNGSNATLRSYEGYEKQFADDMRWMEELPKYFEDENFVFVHAGVNINKFMTDQTTYELLWVRESFIYNPQKYNKRVVFGHTPTLTLTGSDKPVYTFSGNICIDTGCVFGGSLTALVIEDGEIKGFFQEESANKKEEEQEQYFSNFDIDNFDDEGDVFYDDEEQWCME